MGGERGRRATGKPCFGKPSGLRAVGPRLPPRPKSGGPLSLRSLANRATTMDGRVALVGLGVGERLIDLPVLAGCPGDTPIERAAAKISCHSELTGEVHERPRLFRLSRRVRVRSWCRKPVRRCPPRPFAARSGQGIPPIRRQSECGIPRSGEACGVGRGTLGGHRWPRSGRRPLATSDIGTVRMPGPPGP